MKKIRVYISVLVGVFVLAAAGAMAPGLAPADSDDLNKNETEREECEIDCNESFGGVENIRPPYISEAQARAWAHCMLKCERKYWKNFGKDTESSE